MLLSYIEIKMSVHHLSTLCTGKQLTAKLQGWCNDLSQQLERKQQHFDERSDNWKAGRIGRYHARVLYKLYFGISKIEYQSSLNRSALLRRPTSP
jgi:hypothetical protein